MIVPECRPLWHGVEEADSLVLNPHKWLGVSFDCSVYFVRDPEHLVRVMSTNPSYLRTTADAQVKSFRDWGIPLGRRFRALKLWFLIREQGVSGLQARIRRDLANAKWLASQVDAAPDWKRVAPAPLQTVCVRHEPPGLSGDALDTHTASGKGNAQLFTNPRVGFHARASRPNEPCRAAASSAAAGFSPRAAAPSRRASASWPCASSAL